MHPFDLPEPLSDKSISILLDLAVLHFLLQITLAPTTSLSFGQATLHFFLLRIFLHSPISSAFIACCRFIASVTHPSLSAPVSPSFSAKSSNPRRRTSAHSSRRLPRSSAKTFAALLLPRLRVPVGSTCVLILFGERLPLMVIFRRAGTASPSKSVDPAASLATPFLSCSESDGASCVSSLGSDGASRVSSLGSDGASRVSCAGSGGASRVSSSGSGGASFVSSLGSDGASRVSSSGSDGASRVSSSRSDGASRVFPVCVLVMPAAAPAPAPVL